MGVTDIMVDADTCLSMTSPSVSAQRFPKNISPEAVIDATTRCDRYTVSVGDLDDASIDKQDQGWLVTSGDQGWVTLVCGNVWLYLSGVDDDSEALLGDVVATIDAIAE